MPSLAIIILTHNEAQHIERAIAAVAGVATEVFVVDSFSSDNTVELARASGAVVLQNEFVNYARQFNWALVNAPITADWIMRLDADEVVEPNLADEIHDKLQTLEPDVVGINLKRKHIFMDRWIKYGGRYPLVLLRIWRRGHGRIENRWMDEHMIVSGGRIITFSGGFADHNLNDLTFFTEKHNKYATREAIDILNAKYQLFSKDELSIETTSLQAAAKRFMKEKVYNRLPFWVGPSAYFLYRYIAQLGFLDGRAGLIYHFLQGGWYRFLVNAKVAEFEEKLRGCRNREERIRKLEASSRYHLGP